MERLIRSLPWEMLGDRPVFVALTYPGDWQRWVPDGRTFEGHRRAIAERMRRYWWPEALVGMWSKEFQTRGAPHLHLYVNLPARVSAEDYEELRRRTVKRRQMETQYGNFHARARVAAIDGEFGLWLRTAWAEVVTGNTVPRHHVRGADVAVVYWTEEQARTRSRTAVAAYMGGEMAKREQKVPPEGFRGVGKFYGTFGRQAGFEPVKETFELAEDVGEVVARVMARWVRVRLLAGRKARGLELRFDRRRPSDGVTALDFGPAELGRAVRFAEGVVARRGGRPRRKAERWAHEARAAELWGDQGAEALWGDQGAEALWD